ncbi:MAG: indolepyruvate ferredoxin oxidoreductase family protein [Gemmatimonadales bacterium]
MATRTLADRYTLERGTIALSGVQALVRLPMDQHRADRRAGLDTATLISGYRGSPLGGYDFQLQAARPLLEAHQIRFLPAVNEDLGATAVFGAQLANTFPKPKHDGVLGIWYGKGPGVDRSGDAFKHANLTGVGRHGGVLAVAGDDPASKSSTIPSASEYALYDAGMPVLYPADVQDVLDLGLLGFALSRYSGLWVGFKMVTNVADEFSTAEVAPDRVTIRRPDFEHRGAPWQARQSHLLFAPYNLAMEQEQFEGRLEAARRFAAANGLNRITVRSPGARLGVMAAGKTYLDVREAFQRLGFDERELEAAGIRLLKIGMIHPLEPGIVREFARGLDEILVVEEKRPFLELFVRDALYNEPERPRVVGTHDERGCPLVPAHSELESDSVAPILASRLAGLVSDIEGRLARLAPSLPPEVAPLGPEGLRLAYFCSGCPHNRSTVVPEGSIAAVGIGCHGMAAMMERGGSGFTQMGGEGAQWTGAAPFTETPHLFQNLGDGTYFHSGSLAIRQAVAAKVDLTYKILYNGAVAMTGGQHADGAVPIPELTRVLAAEGVARTIVVAEEPARYWRQSLPPGVEVWPRTRLDEAQRALRDTKGVTALIYDQHCAADLRRLRKRGLAPERPLRVVINERICEGCGDCGVKSNCLSVQPVETEFGRKTRIHQSSCNTDYSCLEGDCPAFMTVPAHGRPHTEPRAAHDPRLAALGELPAPEAPRPRSANLYATGIGGTGVVTVNQILAMAAMIEGKSVRSLDQTGLSQKGGAVVSHCRIFEEPVEVSNKIGVGEADVYLGFDLLAANDVRNLSRARPDRTAAVISSSHVPTGLMVRNPSVSFPEEAVLERRIAGVTDPGRRLYLDAEGIAETLFGSHLPANLILVGAAWQLGVIPLAAESIEAAIALNGAAVEANVAAFRAGRKTALDPDWLRPCAPTATAAAPSSLPADAQRLIDTTGASGELRRLLEIRVPDLIAYQSEGYAERYVELVARVHAREREVTGREELAEAVARYLYKLMAYKDEYEVARLALDPEVRRTMAAEHGSKRSYHLHPPLLRSLGLKRKLRFGRWFDNVFRVLRAGRRLRGTALDPFGYHPIRRLERQLIGEYREAIEAELAELTAETHARAVAIARLPDVIRGYEAVKLASVARYRTALHEARAATVAPTEAPATIA